MSRAENQPLAIIEAMSFGLPIISTTVGAIPEVVKHEVNGLLVPPGDVSALHSTLIRCLNNPDELIVFGQNSESRQRALFSLDANVTSFIDQYEVLTKSR